MLYLKSVIIDKIKSFGHQSLMFNKGFTCIVGPNGSGKSTICDALLFGLGERTLHRLRADRLDELIRSSGKGKKGEIRRAYVRLEFSGDEEISVTRFIRSDGKSKYKVNGKTMRRHEVLEILGRHGMRVDETNTIAQGEINMLSQMSAVDLRELIDSAAGIKDFEYKKAESMRELEKVDQKIGESRIMLSERSGFLGELSEEKEAAERYLQMGARLKALTYSTLMTKKGSAEKSLLDYESGLAAAGEKHKSLAQQLSDVSAHLTTLNEDRQKLTKQLSDSTESIGSTNAKLEAINIQIARLDAEMNALASSASEYSKSFSGMESEYASKKSLVDSNAAKLDSLGKKAAPLEAVAKSARATAEKFEGNPERIKELGTEVEELESRVLSRSSDISRLEAELSVIKSRSEGKAVELGSVKELLKKKESDAVELDKVYQSANKKRGEYVERSRELMQKIKDIEGRLGAIDEKLIDLREKKAYAQPRTQNVADRLGERFGKGQGFHGRVLDLCTYKPEHAPAVESAAGSRFEYFVVDDIDTADVVIDYMKANGLGRATFIPIRELKYREDGREKSLMHMLDLIKYEGKFGKVFSYVFGNTYLVNGIDDAKKYGVGKHRYVTTEGDIVEQAGIVSGGSASKRMSLAVINAQLQELASEKNALREELEDKGKKLEEARKGEAYADMEIGSAKGSLNLASVEAAGHRKEIEAISKVLAEFSIKESTVAKMLSKTTEERESIETKLKTVRKQLDDAVNQTVELTKRMAKSGSSQMELDRAEEARKELEGIRISIAELSKENKMHDARLKELAAQMKDAKSMLKNAGAEMSKKKSEREQLTIQRKDIEARISSSSGESKKIFGRIGQLDSEIEKIGAKKGKLDAEMSVLDRQISETNIRKAQLQTTLNDLKAELSVYKDSVELVNATVQEMERESAVLNSKIHELGNVNLRAPELYAEKAKDVEEAKGKVETLETERLAVLRMIEEIESKKLQTFMSTFNDVVLNFTKFCGYVLQGEPSIGLTNPKEPFKSGLDISIREGKTRKHLSKLSGGEKALVLLILIFSIHMYKPAALYVFDEVDTALDKENSKKLSLLIKQMSSNAQFIVVSHNDSLITNADAAVGVVKSHEESKAVGLEVAAMLKSKK